MERSRAGRGRDRVPYIGIVSGLVNAIRYTVCGNTVENAYSALMERVYYHIESGVYVPPFVPDMATVNLALADFIDAFRSTITTTAPEDFRVYPETYYKGRKLKLYQRARDAIRGKPDFKEIRRISHIRAFVKTEKLMVKDKRLVPRLIQPRRPEYNVCVGRFIRQIEHSIYHRLDGMLGGPSVMKGYNSFQQGLHISNAWLEFADPVAIMLDAVRFDQHVSVPLLTIEHFLYCEHFNGPDREELATLLRAQLHNHGSIECADGFIRYQTDGCRASGDMNTSMGNVLIMCGIIYSFKCKHKLKLRLINNGDDCCIIVERPDVGIVTTHIPAFMAQLGLLIEIEGTTSILEEVSFCQTHPVFNGQVWRMVRDPRVAIAKDLTITRRFQPLELRCYLHELGVCGNSFNSDIPVFGAFYRLLMRDVEDFSSGMRQHVSTSLMDSGLYRLASGCRARGTTITDACRASFGLAFNVSPDLQRRLESIYDLAGVGDGVLHPIPAKDLYF